MLRKAPFFVYDWFFCLVSQRLDKLLVPEIEEKDTDLYGPVRDPKKAGTNENSKLMTNSV